MKARKKKDSQAKKRAEAARREIAERLKRLRNGKLSTGKLSTGKLSTGKLRTGKLTTGKLITGKLRFNEDRIAKEREKQAKKDRDEHWRKFFKDKAEREKEEAQNAIHPLPEIPSGPTRALGYDFQAAEFAADNLPVDLLRSALGELPAIPSPDQDALELFSLGALFVVSSYPPPDESIGGYPRYSGIRTGLEAILFYARVDDDGSPGDEHEGNPNNGTPLAFTMLTNWAEYFSDYPESTGEAEWSALSVKPRLDSAKRALESLEKVLWEMKVWTGPGGRGVRPSGAPAKPKDGQKWFLKNWADEVRAIRALIEEIKAVEALASDIQARPGKPESWFGSGGNPLSWLVTEQSSWRHIFWETFQPFTRIYQLPILTPPEHPGSPSTIPMTTDGSGTVLDSYIGELQGFKETWAAVGVASEQWAADLGERMQGIANEMELIRNIIKAGKKWQSKW